MPSTRHRERPLGARRSRILDCFVVLLLAMTYALPALAEEKNLDDVLAESTGQEIEESTEAIYSPEHCDFEITFPEEPLEAKRCPESSPKCYKITSYTMVYDLRTTVDVSVTCVPSPPRNFERYNERVMQTVLNGMTTGAGLADGSINIAEKEDYRIGTLVGTAKHGKDNKIYNAQIWVGQNSIMTIEAKLIGPTYHEADAVFADILKSIKKKD